ncbi:MAG: histidine kinase, partial [Novosphingobium sp. 35-62-5]
MPLLTQTALVLIGVLLAAWTAGAGWFVLDARRRARKGEAVLRQARKLGRMVDESPALPLLVRADGRIEGPARLAGWLGFDAMPGYLSELDAEGRGFDEVQLSRLSDAVRKAQKTGAPFRMALTPKGGTRSLAAHGHLADPQVSPGGSALVWFFDFSESQEELVRLREETQSAKADFAGLSGLIEAAPLPMWFRGPDLRLRLVNSAYVKAVGAASAEAAIAQGTELIEPIDGLSAAQVARQAQSRRVPVERSLLATVKGQRRAVRVIDLPLGEDGVAGYAVDIEEMEELIRQFRRFREAQREMLDTLSAGIAQFDDKRNLVFANQPFLRIFGVPQAWVVDTPPFDRVLDRMRDAGRLPEVRDFPEWRRERQAWFLSRIPVEESWHLSGGTHLRVVGQPMPDGGLLMIFEDRTEQLQLSATR